MANQQTFYHIQKSSNSNLLDTSIPSTTLTSTTLPLTLRSLLPSDIPILTSLLSDPANTRDDLSISQATPAELESIIRSWLTATTPLSKLNFLVLANDIPVGISGFGWIGLYKEGNGDDVSSFDHGDGGLAGAVGIVLNPEVRRRGYGFEALRISIDYGLRELGLKEVRLGTTSRNVGMRGLMGRRFGWVKGEVTEADRFGNDLEWRFGRGDLESLGD